MHSIMSVPDCYLCFLIITDGEQFVAACFFFPLSSMWRGIPRYICGVLALVVFLYVVLSFLLCLSFQQVILNRV